MTHYSFECSNARAIRLCMEASHLFHTSIGWSSAGASLCTYIKRNPLRWFAPILHLFQAFKQRSLQKDLSHATDPIRRVRRNYSMVCMVWKHISLQRCRVSTSAFGLFRAFVHFLPPHHFFLFSWSLQILSKFPSKGFYYLIGQQVQLGWDEIRCKQDILHIFSESFS